MPANLTIYKASAGSGKTYRLTEEYLLLLLRQPEKYRQILAVTFTNKATAEMKDRIITELGNLAQGKQTGHRAALAKNLNLSEDEIKGRSKQLLSFILHDYSRFTIETIDTFFQRVFRSFAHEINLPGNLAIELDYSTYLEQTIDVMLNDAPDNERLQQWVTDFASYRINEGKNWNFKEQLYDLAQHIFNEKYRLLSAQLEAIIADKDSIRNYQKQCQQIIDEFEAVISRSGKKAIHMIENAGLSVDDFPYKHAGVAGFFVKCAQGEIPGEVKKRPLQALEGEDKVWFSAKSPKKDQITALRDGGLMDLLGELIHSLQNDSRAYYTAKTILPNLYTLGLISDVSRQLRKITEEQNVFFLADTGPLIRSVIDDNPVPFIYEKMGNRYHHYMIDEFQDTSEIQWSNFKPLVNETIGSGYTNLIVGDVKQSIYRWRNSNWNILATRLNHEFSASVLNHRSLNINWRSRPNIIRFNNLLFSTLAGLLQDDFNQSLTDAGSNPYADLIRKAYADVIQNFSTKSKTGIEGYVQVNLIEDENWKEATLEKMLDILTDVLKKGVRFGDIAVLVRNQREGQMVADALLGHQDELSAIAGTDLELVSNSGLSLKEAYVVKLIICLLKYMVQPTDLINVAEIFFLLGPGKNGKAIHAFQDVDEAIKQVFPPEFTDECDVLRSQPLYQVVEKLIVYFDLEKDRYQNAFLYTFLDCVAGFTQNHSSDISSFLDWWATEGKNQSVSNSGGNNALQIMTIHKSKGLEFHTVIIPFANWYMDALPGKGDVLWCQPKEDPFKQLPLVPVHYKKDLVKTFFSEEYEFERIQNLVDNLNILYVAATRAGVNLFMLTRNSSSEGFQKASNLLCHFFHSNGFSELQGASFENNEFTFGMLSVVEKDSFPANQSMQFTACFKNKKPVIENLTQDLKYRASFRDKGNKTEGSILDYGKIMHWVFERITYTGDIKNAVRAAVQEGLIEHGAQGETEKMIRNKIVQSGVAHWFTDEYKIRTEAGLLVPQFGSKRPDRVMLKDDEAVVVDFKFGARNDDVYKQQVGEYKQVLSDMGYNHVTGYVWYIMENSLLEV